MKKLFAVLALVMLLALSACGGGGSMSVVGDGSTVTVEAKNAEDMDGSASITVGEDEMIVVAPQLSTGSLHVKIMHEGSPADAMPTIEWDYEGTEPTEYGMMDPGDYEVYVTAEQPVTGTLKIYTAPMEIPDFGGEGETAVYESADGWAVRYNPDVITVNEGDSTVGFVYTGESAGTNIMTVQRIEGQMPEEVLYDVTSAWGDQEEIGRSEGFFPGTDDKWGYWRVLGPAEEGSGLSQTAIAGEYNGGTLLFEFAEHMSGDDEIDLPVSDALAEIIDSIAYENFEPQSMYDYCPGTYRTGDEFVTVEEDHTGTLRLLEDGEATDLEIVWGTASLWGENGTVYEFTIEGESLYLNEFEDWVQFTK